MTLFKVSRDIAWFLLVGLMIFISLGFLNASFTNFNVNFKVSDITGGEEVLRIKFNRIKGQVTYLGYDKEENIYDTRQFNGWFLRWSNFYIFLSWVTESPFSPRYFSFDAYYIKEELPGKYVLLNHQRGVRLTEDHRSVPLKGIFSSCIQPINEMKATLQD
ncbi:hypothetical protein [Vibrio crassostreae]|uniref:hypothetical protein n=1 Tax=Vibrio crassostreae TaxID=246167 RepID=UPI002E196BB0|nr:hypothetical protein [Vibrio crassostreae]